MKKAIIIPAISIVTVMFSCCSNQEQTPARAGTGDSAGIGHEKGKGTPYRGDSMVKGLQSDTIRPK